MTAIHRIPMTRAEKHRSECIRWMADFEPTLFVTFVFNSDIGIHGAQSKLEKFHKMLDAKLVGRAALRKPDQRSVYIATIEKPDANLHIHALFKTSDLQRVRFGLVADDIWKKLAPAGNLVIKPVTYAEGVADYITKELRPETSERLLMPPHLERASPTSR
jgi:hypothetical protein